MIMKSLSKDEVLSFCKGHCKTKKKSKLSEILKYNKDTAIKVKFSSVQFIVLPVQFTSVYFPSLP